MIDDFAAAPSSDDDPLDFDSTPLPCGFVPGVAAPSGDDDHPDDTMMMATPPPEFAQVGQDIVGSPSGVRAVLSGDGTRLAVGGAGRGGPPSSSSPLGPQTDADGGEEEDDPTLLNSGLVRVYEPVDVGEEDGESKSKSEGEGQRWTPAGGDIRGETAHELLGRTLALSRDGSVLFASAVGFGIVPVYRLVLDSTNECLDTERRIVVVGGNAGRFCLNSIEATTSTRRNGSTRRRREYDNGLLKKGKEGGATANKFSSHSSKSLAGTATRLIKSDSLVYHYEQSAKY